jgi:hypothetical protein
MTNFLTVTNEQVEVMKSQYCRFTAIYMTPHHYAVDKPSFYVTSSGKPNTPQWFAQVLAQSAAWNDNYSMSLQTAIAIGIESLFIETYKEYA